MKKFLSIITIFLTLLVCSVGLIGCNNESTPPPNLSTIELTKSNLFDYVSFNVSYSEYSISYLDGEYLITCRVEFSTAPRRPNIEFKDTTIKYAQGFIAIGFDLKTTLSIESQLDYKGYSTTSFYCYKKAATYSPENGSPNSEIKIADISSVEGFVVIEEA